MIKNLFIAIPTTGDVHVETALSRTASFTLRQRDYSGKPWPFRMKDGVVSVPGVGLGLALIARSVFETMIEKGCVERIAGQEPQYPDETSWGFFDRVRDPGDKKWGGWMSEDLSFCKRWVHDCGGQILVRSNATIQHIGNYKFTGSLMGRFTATPDKAHNGSGR